MSTYPLSKNLNTSTRLLNFMPTELKLTNPYEGIERQDAKPGEPPVYIRVATTTSYDDIMTIRKVIVNEGWRMAVINRVFKRIADHCRKNNFTFNDEQQLIDYILAIVDEPIAPVIKTSKKKKESIHA